MFSILSLGCSSSYFKQKRETWRGGRDWRQSSSPSRQKQCSDMGQDRAGQSCWVLEMHGGLFLSKVGEAGKEDYISGCILQGVREPEGSQHCLQLHLPPWVKALRERSCSGIRNVSSITKLLQDAQLDAHLQNHYCNGYCPSQTSVMSAHHCPHGPPQQPIFAWPTGALNQVLKWNSCLWARIPHFHQV